MLLWPLVHAPVFEPLPNWSCNSRANLDYEMIKSFKDNGLLLFLVGYESGKDETLTPIRKGVTTDEIRRFTKDCHRAVIHGTFILGLPIETKETVEQTIRFAQELDRAGKSKENANGVPSQSPGSRGTSYPGKASEENHNPNGVEANVTRPPNENGIDATGLRLMVCWTMTKVGAGAPTLGWRPMPLWGIQFARP